MLRYEIEMAMENLTDTEREALAARTMQVEVHTQPGSEEEGMADIHWLAIGAWERTGKWGRVFDTKRCFYHEVEVGGGKTMDRLIQMRDAINSGYLTEFDAAGLPKEDA